MHVHHHHTAEDFLSTVHPYIPEASANIVLAHAWGLKNTSASAENLGGATGLAAMSKVPENFWLTVWQTTDVASKSLVAVAACVRGELGNCPIFLWSTRREMLERAMNSVADEIVAFLASRLLHTRVFSVFGNYSLVNAFTSAWIKRTGFRNFPEPYYHASFLTCTIDTLTASDGYIPEQDTVRMAGKGDLRVVSQMCEQFAKLSIHFPLSADRAAFEASHMISHEQLFVYEHDSMITSICAVTRETQNVVAITKVYTSPAFRKNGYAERLVRYVTRRMLLDRKKTAVVLYAGVENSARSVYERIGFRPPRPESETEAEVLEVGFIGTEKGHW
ncbi:acetyltransferase [Moniliophthora roreri]|uniref:N-acetyltransferase domain-containing protein n=1 Tax=Moniliophthora roreri TaxID=221103 RepID=A0A0W0F1R1_MONRR|nr:acetyltransferase [Moniliophthora roreri]